jgi:hypothetical protein
MNLNSKGVVDVLTRREAMKPILRTIKRAVRKWWECRTKRCDYFRHYLAYGPAELTHEGYHAAEDLGARHFASCHYEGPGLCKTCSNWEMRLRA